MDLKFISTAKPPRYGNKKPAATLPKVAIKAKLPKPTIMSSQGSFNIENRSLRNSTHDSVTDF